MVDRYEIQVGVGWCAVFPVKQHHAAFGQDVGCELDDALARLGRERGDGANDGIVLQAVGITLGVFVVMLVLYRTGVIRVTDKMRRTVIGATMGVAVFYGISFLMSLFGANISFLNSSSLISICFSLLVAGLAAMNLALDFDFIERGEQSGLPKYFEWYAAFGLLVTMVWLYLEILRLLAKLRDR